MVYSAEQDTFIVMSYYRNGIRRNGEWIYSITACKEEYLLQYPELHVQETSLIAHIRDVVNRFSRTGSVAKGKSQGRPAVAEDVVEDLRQRMQERPRTSLKRLSQESGVPLSTCQKILKKRLKLHPYKIVSIHQLLPIDPPRRLAYCNWFNNILNDDRLLDLSFFSDEAWFHLSGYVNSQNYRIWSAENPHEFIETPLHAQKIGVWLAVSRRRLYGPIFFQETVTAERYRNNFLDPFINQLDDEELRLGYFQQDGAPAHTAANTLTFLQEFYDDRVISLRLPTEFPPRSPDLTPLDFSLFGYLKDNVFREPVHTLEELQARITICCQNIDGLMLRNIFDNMKRRVALCIQHNGQHFQQFL